MIQARTALAPDGLFLGAMISPGSLAPIAAAFAQAESEILGGTSPRFAPAIDLRDVAGLLQRAGFALPVADIEKIAVEHSHPLKLLADVRAMGDANALTHRPSRGLRRDVLARACEILGHGPLVTEFEIIMLAGWAPAASQQKPLKPGSGAISLTEALR